MKLLFMTLSLFAALLISGTTARAGSDLDKRVEHGYADSNGVKIHYASLGKGPLVVMIHGFPDLWYSCIPCGQNGRFVQLCTSRTVPITPALIHAASVCLSGVLL